MSPDVPGELSMDLYRERRERFLSSMEPGVAIFPSAPQRVRSNDSDHRYRPDSDLFYLTGLTEPESLLVLKPADPVERSTLLVRPSDPEREVWTGPRVGVERARELFGVDRTESIERAEEVLARALANTDRVYFRLGRFPENEAMVHRVMAHLARRNREGIDAPQTFVDPATILHGMRLIKSGGDLPLVRRAAQVSVEGHLAAMRTVRPGLWEYELEAVVDYVFRRRGASGPAFSTTVASGPNACYLHYNEGSRRMGEGDLVLVDAGAECDLFAGDVTRTYPVDGRFRAPQARVYQIVLDAQTAAIAKARPGGRFQDVHDAAVEVLTSGLIELGLVDGPLATAIEQESYKPFYMHRTSHWLGLDVHDVGRYRVKGAWRTFEPGHLLTVEPGLYLRADCPRVPPELAGIGVRIEDDVLITSDGCDVITAAVPRSIVDLEAELALPRRF